MKRSAATAVPEVDHQKIKRRRIPEVCSSSPSFLEHAPFSIVPLFDHNNNDNVLGCSSGFLERRGCSLTRPRARPDFPLLGPCSSLLFFLFSSFRRTRSFR